MDDSGRLHMPGFVGKTFTQSGLKDELDEAARAKVEGAALRGAADLGMNRKSRRKMLSGANKERIA